MEPLNVSAIVNKLRKFEKINVDPSQTQDTSVAIDASIVVASAIGSAIAYHLPLPSEQVPLPVTYFSEQFKNIVEEALSAINEQFLIRTQIAYNSCKETYLNRYKYLYSPLDSLEQLLQRGVIINSNTSFTTQVLDSVIMEAGDEFRELLKSINLSCGSSNNYKGIVLA